MDSFLSQFSRSVVRERLAEFRKDRVPSFDDLYVGFLCQIREFLFQIFFDEVMDFTC